MRNIFTFIFLVWALSLAAQTENTPARTIEVNGSADREVEPDEMILIIGIREYWEEEFEENTEPEDYKTKVPLAKIENDLIKKLRQTGIDKQDVKVRNVGNYWRQQGKEFLFSKEFEVELHDFTKVNELMDLLDAKGINRMHVGELRHSKMDEFENQVKIEALKNARRKALVLVESLGEELGEVVTIKEVSAGFTGPVMAGEMMARTAEVAEERINQIRNIKLEYKVQATFRIKD
ncbi:MAG: SIMPL domain-containing protein [Prolixibacteraceae bacterium]